VDGSRCHLVRRYASAQAKLSGDRAPQRKGHSSPHFRPMSIVAKRSPISATAELLLYKATIENCYCVLDLSPPTERPTGPLSELRGTAFSFFSSFSLILFECMLWTKLLAYNHRQLLIVTSFGRCYGIL